MNESQFWIRRSGGLELGKCQVVLLEIEMRFSHEKVKFRGAFAGSNELRRGFFVEVFQSGAVAREARAYSPRQPSARRRNNRDPEDAAAAVHLVSRGPPIQRVESLSESRS